MNPRGIQLLNLALAAAMLWTLFFPIGAVGGGTVVRWGASQFGGITPGASNVVAIAAGLEQSLLLMDDGTIADLGKFWEPGEELPITVPPDLTNVVGIAADGDYSLALKADGTVVGWDTSGPLEMPAGLTNVAAISACARRNLALRTDGTVVAWGYWTNAPIDLSNVVAVAACALSQFLLDLALRPDGTVLAWDATGSSVQVPPGWTNIVSISGGYGELLALKADGTVVAWPGGTYTELFGLPNLTNVVAISASCGNDGHVSLALLADGTVVGWGLGSSPGGPFVPPGLSNIVAVAGGGILDLALVGGGPPFLTTRLVNRTAVITSTVYFRVEATGAWPLSYQWQFNGTNLPGATTAVLGLTNLQPGQAGAYSVTVSNACGTVTSEACLLTVVPALPVTITAQPQDQVTFVRGAVTFEVLAQGSGPLSYRWTFDGLELNEATHATLALSNAQPAQAGLYSVEVSNAVGTVTSRNASLSVVQVAAWGAPGQNEVPPELTNPPASLAGGDQALALRADGSVLAWGGTNEVPASLTGLVAIADGDGFGLALKADGSVLAWGGNSYGQTNLPAGLTNAVAISARYYHGLALTADGSVMVWGHNWAGSATAPTGLGEVVAVAAGAAHNLVLRADGSLFAWGDNSFGQTNVPAGLSNVVAIAAGDWHSLALKADGTVVAFGYNDAGETNVPPGLANVVAIACGGVHSLALQADGTVTAWGLDVYGETTVPAGLSNVTMIAGGDYFSLALVGDAPPVVRVSLLSPSWNAGGFSVSLPTQSGRVYRLEYKSSLADANWIALPLVAGTGGLRQLTDPTATGTQRFYRVRRW